MRKGLLSLLVALIAWSWPGVMIRMLRLDFDVYTMSFFRYLSAGVFLLTFGLIFSRDKLVDAAKSLKILIIPALLMTVHQIFFTKGVFMTSAVVSSLMGRLSAITIPALSCIFYEDERKVVGNKYYLLGAFLAMGGVIGVVLGKSTVKIDGFNLGILFIMIGSLGWSIYIVLVKKLVRSLDPLAIITFVSLLAALFFLPEVLIYGNIHKITQVSTGKQMLLLGSGVLGVGIGNAFYYNAVKQVGNSISVVLMLMLPLNVGVIAFFLLGETLTVMQIASGAVLIFGCWFVAKFARRAAIAKGL